MMPIKANINKTKTNASLYYYGFKEEEGWDNIVPRPVGFLIVTSNP